MAPASESAAKLMRASQPILNRLNALWVRSWPFKRLAKKVFEDADLDKSGSLSAAELYVALLRMYDKANAYLMTHVRAPSKKEVFELLKKYDFNKDGSLDFEEFFKCAQTIMGLASPDHSIPLNILAVLLLRVSILPSIAKIITSTSESFGGAVSLLSWIPIAAWTIVLETVLRFVWASYSSDA